MTREEAISVLNMVEAHGLADEAKKEAIKALETVEEFKKAQIITGGRLNGRTYAYKCGLEDGKRKALEQEPILDKIRAEIETQEKWLAQSGYNAYNVDIAFNSIKLVLVEKRSEDGEK